MSDIGSRLKEARKQRGLTQRSLAKCLCKSPSAISGYENNEQIPPVDVLVSISRLLNVSVDYLVGIEHKKVFSISGLTQEQIELVELIFSEFNAPSSTGKLLSAQQTQIIQKLILLFQKSH